MCQHGRVRRPALAIVLLALAPSACREAARGLASGPAGGDGPRALVEALADRFGPIDREPAFDALRPKLARAALVPSRVFDDGTAWQITANSLQRHGETLLAEGDVRIWKGAHSLSCQKAV